MLIENYGNEDRFYIAAYPAANWHTRDKQRWYFVTENTRGRVEDYEADPQKAQRFRTFEELKAWLIANTLQEDDNTIMFFYSTTLEPPHIYTNMAFPYSAEGVFTQDQAYQAEGYSYDLLEQYHGGGQ